MQHGQEYALRLTYNGAMVVYPQDNTDLLGNDPIAESHVQPVGLCQCRPYRDEQTQPLCSSHPHRQYQSWNVCDTAYWFPVATRDEL